MPEPIFPADRFKRAGATEDELAQLVTEFERSDLGVQTSLANRYESMSEGALRENLEDVRDSGHFTKPDEDSKPDEGTEESMAASDDPGLESGATEDEPSVEKKAAPRTRAAAAKK